MLWPKPCGRQTIPAGTDVSGAADIISSGKDEIIVPRGNSEALADKMLNLRKIATFGFVCRRTSVHRIQSGYRESYSGVTKHRTIAP